jgi:hypothetical protein
MDALAIRSPEGVRGDYGQLRPGAAWLVAIFVFALTKPDIRRSMGSVPRVIFGSVALTGMLAAAAYVIGIVLLIPRSQVRFLYGPS